MTKQEKLLQALKLQQAKKTGDEGFILLQRIDDVEEALSQKIDMIKIPDNSDIKSELKKIKEDLQEELIIELDII